MVPPPKKGIYAIRGTTVSCKSSKQTCIAKSVIKSEIIVLDKAGEEAGWPWNFLEDIPS
jgi:hypothetical protein